MTNEREKSNYRVIQLGAPGLNGLQVNEAVTDFDGLVTHHPKDNRNARMQDGVVAYGQLGRAHAFIDGEVQEIETPRNRKAYGLKPDQVLLKKDFILESPNHSRFVDVPAPTAGYIGRVSEREGLVDILDHQGGDVIARIRHMHPIAVTAGQTVKYGESLGTQGRQQTGAIHVHLEMDTRYHQQFENYIADLVSGRLPIQAEHRRNVQPLPVVDDGTFRLGETDDRVRALQRVMANEGYRATGGRPLDQDGVYRLSMQGALLDFQYDHGVKQTGDIDPATLQFAPPARSREMDRQDYFMPSQPIHRGDAEPAAAPGHPDHPDHRPGLPDPLPARVNQHGAQALSTGDLDLDRLATALFADNDQSISAACEQIAASSSCQIAIQYGQELHAAQLAEEQHHAQQAQRPVRSR